MNATNETSISRLYTFSLGGQIARGVINFIFCVIVGYAIRNIVKNRTMEAMSKLLIGNLMLAHFLFWFASLVRIPVVPYLYDKGCLVLVYVTVTLLYGTVVAVVAVSTDRFLAVRFPYQYKRVSKRYVYLLIVTLWVCAILLSFGTLYGENNESQACAPWKALPQHGLWVFGVVVLMSTSSVVAMSTYVMKEILRHNRSIHNTTVSRDRGFRRKIRLLRKQIETTLTFIVMSASYCMMVCPLVIIFPLLDSDENDDPTMIVLMTIFSIFSRVADPFVYILRVKILKAICSRCLSVTQNADSTTITLTADQGQHKATAGTSNPSTINMDCGRKDPGLSAPDVAYISSGIVRSSFDVDEDNLAKEGKLGDIQQHPCSKKNQFRQVCNTQINNIETLYI